MLFNSLDFLLFFPVVVSVYLLLPRKARTVWLLVTSYFFYCSWNPKYAALLAFSTAASYGAGLLLARCGEPGDARAARRKKWILAACLSLHIAVLVFFKYLDFALVNLDALLRLTGLDAVERRFDLLLPLGISFYTFQILGYLIDVYRGKVPAEKNFLRYALFVSFFPQIVSGPIARAPGLLKQMQQIEQMDVRNFERVRNGLLLMLWGLFQKLVIADRAALLVNEVFGNYALYGFAEIAIAVLLYAFQIYCDFCGYTNMACGAAKVLGFDLIRNFRQPYFATGIRDFWRRWHISLTSWFTDYLYIPLGGNRRGTLRKYINVCIVFLASGLWHGASWNYVVWGALHAVYQIAGDVKQRLQARKAPRVYGATTAACSRLCKTLVTFLLVDFAWIFFAASGIKHALLLVRQMCTNFVRPDLLSLGLNAGNWITLLCALGILLTVDILHERGKSVFALVTGQKLWLRWLLYLGLLWTTILFGIYGVSYSTGSFIYSQF